MLVPKLRFKREDGTDYPEWEKNKWSALGDFVASGTLSKADLAETGTPCILYGELYTKYGEIAHMIYSKTSATSHTFSQSDDVILPKSGETPEDISTATCIPYDNISLGGDLIVFRHNEKVIGAYLSYLISNRAKNAIASIAQGKSVVHINEKSLANIELPYPDIEEQQKIADFLSAVDEVIAQSEAEVQNLEQQKKAAMQKIFLQEVRFKREDGTDYPEWENQKLSAVSSRVTRKNKGNITDIPLTIASLYGLVDQREYFKKTIASQNMEGYYLLHNGEFAYNKSYSKGFDFGAIKRLDRYDCGALSTLYICFAVNNKVDSDFMTHYFDSQKWNKEVSIRCAEGARNHGLLNISTDDFFDIDMTLPTDLEEQQKIADFLSAYDEAISYAKQELDKWKELKKGLLQQMFV
jgi:type I restriction enzyme S subunit